VFRLWEATAMTSLKDLAEWFQEGKDEERDYMIVVCDTFDWEDYPVYVNAEDFWTEYAKYDGQNMQKIMEVYDLNKPWPEQAQGRVRHMPKRPTQASDVGESG
jgi:hypothetical protein